MASSSAEVEAYSFTRAVADALGPRGVSPAPLGSVSPGPVRDASEEIIRRTGRQPRGFFLPSEVLFRALDSTSGAGAVGTVLAEDPLIAALRPRMALGGLGARFLNLPPGGDGKAAIPRVATGSTVSWTAEGGSPASGTNPTVDQVVFTPKTINAYVDVTRRIYSLVGRPSVERTVLGDLASAVAEAIDRVGFVGMGGGKPTGLLSTVGLPKTDLGTDGGVPTRATLIAMEKAASAVDQSPDASPGWATTVDGRAKLRSIDGTAASGDWLWKADKVLDSPAVASDSLPSTLTKGSGTNLSALVFGLWRNLAVNVFGELDVLIDPYSQAESGMVRIHVYADVDVQIVRPTAFNAVLDLATA